jgi:hypothetical protein
MCRRATCPGLSPRLGERRGLCAFGQVCVVGPSQAGKTYLCRLLAETAQDENYYETTEGVRIQELDRKVKHTRPLRLCWIGAKGMSLGLKAFGRGCVSGDVWRLQPAAESGSCH